MGGGNRLLDSHNFARFTPKFYFILGIIFNLCLLGFFKYTDFLLENFNAFSQIAHLDFNIPLPHILLPLALSFVTFQQIAFLFDCYKHATGQSNENLHIDFIDYALFISFFPQLIAGPIVHHREMMPQFAKMGNSSLARPSRELEKSAFDRQQVLSQADFSVQPTNLTQDTKIANDSKHDSSLQDSPCESKQSKATSDSAEVSLSDFVGFGAIGRENRTLSPLSAQERTIPQKHQRDNRAIYRLGCPSCLAGDIIGDYIFDSPLKIGDKIIIKDMIHYTIVKNNLFNGIPLPSLAILKKNGKLKIVRKFGYDDYKKRNG